MNNFEYILNLLQKNSLSETEKLQLEEILNNDIEAKEFYNSYLKLERALNKSLHISFDEMKDFILVKNNLEPEDNSIFAKLTLIESHLRQCASCKEQFVMMNSELADVENFLAEKLNPPEAPTAPKPEQPSLFKIRNPQYYAIAALLIIGVLFGSMFIVSELTTPITIKYASLDKKTDFYITRGRTTNFFQASIKALDNDDYNSAITFLKKDIQENINSETIFYSYYILALVQLELAKSDFIGLFPAYDDSYAKAGLKNLQHSIELNSSGKYQSLDLNSKFYIAKAYLMLNDPINARKYLKMVIDEKGSKLDEAEIILSELE